MSPCYFERIDAHTFQPTPHISGAWNVTEQHIVPVFGLLTHALETDRNGRRGAGTGEEPLPITRISFDILGTLTVADPMEISCRVILPGRTIELVEAQLSSRGRVQVIARAWFLAGYDTAALAGTALETITPLEEADPWDPSTVWPGDFIGGIEVRRRHFALGRAHYWARTPVELVAGEPVSATGHGLTHSVLHDVEGPVGAVSQALTVRPLG
ncbi:acyl-CoA thioesterase domain-containing protein [Citricoccus sp. NR2]|uniref:acyl-CoA thioesterase domain-containing protein n=1 Tax=Citricoccus sp. NR2 TaxID=3004095 RepID=UPI0022DDBF09|nr:acyl-CoA thioesterase domain-containing protein [Citricoccus sp. NR2]WBL19422.1 thioesterase family protein [Citricoccus sp. NR2]